MRKSVLIALSVSLLAFEYLAPSTCRPEREVPERGRTNPNTDPNPNTRRSSLGSMAHEELPVPIYSSLEPVYGEGSPLEEAQIRFQTLKAKFVELFGQEPEVYARSPGKVLDLRFLWRCFCLEIGGGVGRF